MKEIINNQRLLAASLLSLSIWVSPLWADDAVIQRTGILISTNGIANTNERGDLSVAYDIRNNSDYAYRVFIDERALATDNQGNHWKSYNVDETKGIWACENGNCLDKDRIKEVEENATIVEPGDVLYIVATMAMEGGESTSIGDVASFALSAHVQQIRIEETANGQIFRGGPWHTKSIGLADIPLNVNKN